jgi:hypothetical protein
LHRRCNGQDVAGADRPVGIAIAVEAVAVERREAARA